jgi:hypothetical protein
MRLLNSTSFLVAVLLLSGCIPWRREALVQPALQIRVTSPDGKPLPGARILFVAASNPHGVLHHALELRTDEQGVATLDEERQTETIYPLMMHGVPFYYWTWCVEKDGYVPEVRGIQSPPETPVQTVVLQPGSSGKSCRQHGGRLAVE